MAMARRPGPAHGFFVEQMAMYASYHRDARNKATHFFGVPAIAFSLLIPLAMLPLGAIGGLPVSAATLFFVAVLLFWIVCDWKLGAATGLFFLPLLWLAEIIAAAEKPAAWIAFGFLFVGGWIVQLIGHAFEGRKPALLDNLLQIFIAPTFLMAEAAFRVGWRRDLREAVEARWHAYAAEPRGAGQDNA